MEEFLARIPKYLFTVSLNNLGKGILVSGGFYFIGMTNAAMWGMLATVLNVVPYFCVNGRRRLGMKSWVAAQRGI